MPPRPGGRGGGGGPPNTPEHWTAMDKQSLKKHHFWILLALSVVLIPVVLGGAVFGVGSAAKEQETKIKGHIADLAKQAPKSQAYLEELDKQKAKLEEQRNKVWKEVY